jgi:hypothetical protein
MASLRCGHQSGNGNMQSHIDLLIQSEIQSIRSKSRWLGLFCNRNHTIHVSRSGDLNDNEKYNEVGVETKENYYIIVNYLNHANH